MKKILLLLLAFALLSCSVGVRVDPNGKVRTNIGLDVISF